MSRILIAEDEPSIALGLQGDLALEGYDVEVVGNGDDALQRLHTDPFDLVLLDVMLPGKDGYAVCREVRSARLPVCIILLTAKSDEAEKVLGLELGADDYVTKPFSPLELRARVRAVLRRTADDDPETYCFGDIEVDFARGEVRRGGEDAGITAIELKLLGTFIRRRGRVLSRDQLLDDAWGRGRAPTDRVVDNHIMNLRRKIEPEPETPQFIVSLRGQGYRFDG